MPDTLAILRRQMKSVEDLRSVVRTMKAMAAATITQYDEAVTALNDYCLAVELALSVCLRNAPPGALHHPDRTHSGRGRSGIVLFGGNHGLAGQFNEHVTDAGRERLEQEAIAPVVWTVGERVRTRLEDTGGKVTESLEAPQSVEAIAPLVSDLLLRVERRFARGEIDSLWLCHNAPLEHPDYQTAWKRLLPLDNAWREEMLAQPWPTRMLPEIIDCGMESQTALISEYLFIMIYRTCAESCAAESAARLGAMQRAERNIEDRQADLQLEYNHQRQSIIDEELFDLVSGMEALANAPRTAGESLPARDR